MCMSCSQCINLRLKGGTSKYMCIGNVMPGCRLGSYSEGRGIGSCCSTGCMSNGVRERKPGHDKPWDDDLRLIR